MLIAVRAWLLPKHIKFDGLEGVLSMHLAPWTELTPDLSADFECPQK